MLRNRSIDPQKRIEAKKYSQTSKFCLVTYDQAPEYMKTNPYVTQGYRSYFSFTLCFKSMFRLHNETWNVWTHVLSAILFIYLVYKSQDWITHDGLIDVFFINLFGVACILLFSISSAYHLLSCHSQETHIFFSRLDFAGISIGIVSSMLPGIYSALSCYPTLKWANISVVLCFLVVTSMLLLIPKFASPEYKTIRNTTYTLMGFYGLIPVAIWLAKKGIESEEVQIYFWKMGLAYALFMIGAIIYITRIPERFYPGKLTSVFLQSHILWHLFVTAGSLWLYKVGWEYYEYSEGGTRCE